MRESMPQAATTLTKPEAVRRAIVALGYRAGVTQILDYVRDHFGINTTTPPVASQLAPDAPPPAAALPEPGPSAPPVIDDPVRKPAVKRAKNKDRSGPAE